MPKINFLYTYTILGYTYVTVVRTANDNGERSYYLNDADGRPFQGYLPNAKGDPLDSIINCYIKLAEENGKQIIKGMIVDNDWVEAN